ncbi:NtaA/DmoA family FMN-dependent monooxygenase [Pseudofrankia sp. BMG5.37]|uniref:LLM class flavin-dependent oxidoreductase n=1 Tax=Pseudofrankia sp. BMG5.37 TaxID=3050035 RepID=UPI00289583E4|nr:NtaA/DmoA family FMN-dependent monooxygenase [Pseudofrankia sp. BMG5.37]MDT3446857.1 NtaA/DmoA family FMN-dependent monooxygenase [Pseudofrankia sp. BMG5.37]
MTIDARLIGRELTPVTGAWTERDTRLYALAAGAGSVDPQQELRFATENTANVTQRVLPTFGALEACRVWDRWTSSACAPTNPDCGRGDSSNSAYQTRLERAWPNSRAARTHRPLRMSPVIDAFHHIYRQGDSHMSGAQSTMRLSLFINPTGHHQASWRHPRAQADAGVSFAHYVELAQAAERACFDAVFLADNQCVLAGSPGTFGRVAQYVANFEPLTLISGLIAVTERIGFISTASTSFNYPYQVARKFASMDHMSGGRVGWNIVTSGPVEAPNFGLAEHFEHELRYERAAEFVEVCKGLWDSWEDDAFPRDKASGQFLLPAKVHTLDHDGPHLRVRGPLNVPRSPQGYPVFVQAGSSSTGTAFAARYAEMVFVTPQSVESARQRYQLIKSQVADAGRDPDHVKVMPGLVVIVGRTTEEAREDYERLQSLLHIDVALNIFSLKLGGVDLSPYPLDEPLPMSAEPDRESGFSRPHFGEWAKLGQREGLTLRELALRAAGSMAGIVAYGSATDIADLMEEWFRTGATDGFNIQPAYLPGQLHDFNELVVPELQRRGLMRRTYDGRTLRDHFGLPRP